MFYSLIGLQYLDKFLHRIVFYLLHLQDNNTQSVIDLQSMMKFHVVNNSLLGKSLLNNLLIRQYLSKIQLVIDNNLLRLLNQY